MDNKKIMNLEEIDLRIDTKFIRSILVNFVQTEVSRADYERAVIALSGGVDSSLSCAIAVEALGPDNVLGVRIPYKSSSPDSLDHAQLVIDWLKIPALTLPITDLVDPLIEEIPDISRIRKGNILARARMMIIFDQSAAFKGLVVGTSNKTEILLGYSTIYGDSACAMNPIGDLYKTQVRQLAHDFGIPEDIIKKPPSADLWPGQTDEGELGFTYEKVDKLLYLLVDRRFHPEECIQAGFDETFVDNVLTIIRKSQYKRLLPPIAKISSRTVGYDFLYLRDWGT